MGSPERRKSTSCVLLGEFEGVCEVCCHFNTLLSDILLVLLLATSLLDCTISSDSTAVRDSNIVAKKLRSYALN